MACRIDVVEAVAQVHLCQGQLLAGLLFALLLLRHLLTVLICLALQEAQTALVLPNLLFQDRKFLIDAVNAFEEVVALQHGSFLRQDSLLLAKFEEALLLMF